MPPFKLRAGRGKDFLSLEREIPLQTFSDCNSCLAVRARRRDNAASTLIRDQSRLTSIRQSALYVLEYLHETPLLFDFIARKKCLT
jgi:hypothetical protein